MMRISSEKEENYLYAREIILLLRELPAQYLCVYLSLSLSVSLRLLCVRLLVLSVVEKLEMLQLAGGSIF